MKEEKNYTIEEAIEEAYDHKIVDEKFPTGKKSFTDQMEKLTKMLNDGTLEKNKLLPQKITKEERDKLIQRLIENGDPKNMKDLVRVLTAIKEKEKEKGKGQEPEEGQEPGE